MSILQLCTVRTNTMHAYCDIHENRWHVLALGKIKEKKSWRAVIFRGNWHTKYVRYTIKGSLERQLNRSTGNSGRWKVGWCFYMTATGIFLHIENEFPMYGTGYKHWRKSGFPGYKIQVFFKCTISWLLRTHIRTSRCMRRNRKYYFEKWAETDRQTRQRQLYGGDKKPKLFRSNFPSVSVWT